MTSKENMLTAIRECASELGHCPTLAELKRLRNIGVREVRRLFGSYSEALREAGFDPHGQGFAVSVEEMFTDWGRVARQVGKIPSLADYNEHGRHSVGPFMARFGGWTEVPRGLLQLAREMPLNGEGAWNDVIELIKEHEERRAGKTGRARSLRKDPEKGTVYGAPLITTALAHAPTNEMGVVFLFGMVARRLGFVVTRIQAEFPDCEVLREVEENHWQRLRAEFEFESRNFLTHGHDERECDLIVCWLHNWPECPLEVVELSQSAV